MSATLMRSRLLRQIGVVLFERLDWSQAEATIQERAPVILTPTLNPTLNPTQASLKMKQAEAECTRQQAEGVRAPRVYCKRLLNAEHRTLNT